ncbi:MAG: peptidylprolyl isomerase [Acidobacteria bacterium]|nr:peptidylprolyl isomerase [Acidobacteriota bacterium]
MKSLTKLSVPGFLLLFAGVCFPQGGAKAPTSQPKAAVSTAKPAAKAERAAATDSIFPAVVAKVNGQAIPGRDLEELVQRELTSIGNPEWKNLREEYRHQLTLDLLTGLINSKLLYQKALAGGYKATDAEVQAELKKIAETFSSDAEMNAALASRNTDRAALEKGLYENLTMAKFIEENVHKKIVVTQEDLAKYYSSNPKDFYHPDIVRTSHILIQPAGETAEQDAKARERAETLLARVKRGEDFAKLARENSVDASASQGGDVGFMARDALDPDYAEAAFSVPVGEVKLIKSKFGYHVMKVTDKKKEGVSALDEVKENLTEFLKNEKANEEVNRLVNQLRNEGEIEILIPTTRASNP